MSLNLNGTLTGVLDLFKKLFVGESANLVLLREDGSSAAFEVLDTIETGWNPEFSEEFDYTLFRVADLSAEFAALARKATHLVVTGSLIPGLNNMIHETLKQTAAPDADPTWRIYAKSVGRKYVSTEEI